MAIVIDKKNIQRHVTRLRTTPKTTKETVFQDYVVGGVELKNVPFIKNNTSFSDPYVLSGKTMSRVYKLLLENEQYGRNQKTIEFN